MNLLSRLLVLVAVALLPAIAIQAYTEFDLRRARQIEVQNQALTLAELAAAEQQQIIQGIRQVLVTLSELPSIKARNSSSCNEYLGAIKQRFSAFVTLVATDLSGLTFCTPDANRKPVSIASRAYFANLRNTGAFSVGEFSYGLSTGRKSIQFALPFYGSDSRMAGAIVASLSLDWLANYIAQKGGPAGAELAILDRNGTYLAHYPDNERFVGRKIAGDQLANLQQGAADIVDSDGVERIVGSVTLPDNSGGLLVSFGLDKARAFTEMQHGTERDIFLIVLSIALVLILASLGARRFIDRPLGQLVDAANRWRLGDFSRRVDIKGSSEIARVADAFNTMADALKQREQELSDAKEKAEEAAAQITMIFESTTDSVVILDHDGLITYVNGPAWTDIAEGRDVRGMTLIEAFPDAEDIGITNKIQELTKEQRPIFVEVFCNRRQVWYAVNAFPSSQGLAIFLRDITDHKHALEERHLIEEQFHQSQKMESVGQLTGGIAHDFNNLLTVVSGSLELIEGAADNAKVQQYAAAARRAAERGGKLTAQLLAFSRRQVLNPKLVNANHLICEFQGLIQQAVGDGCELKLQTQEDLWPCDVDPSLLETALLNLAINGRDAMPDGGVLRIETQNVEVEEGALAECPQGPYVRLAVTDSGSGMPPEVRDRIFEPFFTTKEVGKGSGLGLSMVYGFVRQSGGHVVVESTVGVGTTVALYLPRAARTHEVTAPEPKAAAVPGGSERILVVDDNEDLLEVTSAMLSTFGYEVSCARNGLEALNLMKIGEPFSLLFSDIVMPSGMNGIELAREAKRLSKDIKVLLTSGYAGEAMERNNAVDEFPIIDKPFHVADLARRLRTILREA